MFGRTKNNKEDSAISHKDYSGPSSASSSALSESAIEPKQQKNSQNHINSNNNSQNNSSLVFGQTKLQLKLVDFQMIRTLGTGTFGRVYLCRNKTDSRFYALKMMNKSEVVRLKQVEHILSEKQILSSINHPFIVNLLCTFQDTKNVYVLLEFVLGGELFSHLRKAVSFNNETSRFYAAEILLAFEYLHSHQIVYRDLKPENLLLDGNGHIKITDFGFAKFVPDRTWTLCGTPEYLAPEIIQSKGHGKAVDWWAWGVLIYEMLAGFPPFFDEHPLGIYEKILRGRVQFPANFDTNAKDLVKRLLVSDLSKRLGNLRGGADDVKRHKWFNGMDFNALLNRQIPAPFVPKHTHMGDASNFERYPEIDLRQEMQNFGNDPYAHLFRDF